MLDPAPAAEPPISSPVPSCQQWLRDEVYRLEAQFVCLVPDGLWPIPGVVQLARKQADNGLLGRALCLLARMELVEGRHEAGIRVIDEAIALFDSLGDEAALELAGPRAEAWRVAGNAQVKLGNLAEALPLLERSVALAEHGVATGHADERRFSAIPAASALVRSLNNLGFALMGMSEMNGAAEVLRQALGVADTHPETFEDVPEDIVFAIGNLVAILHQGARERLAAGESADAELAEARNLLERRAAQIVAPAGDASPGTTKVTTSAEHDYLESLGQNLLLDGRLEEALEQFRRLADASTENQSHGAASRRGLAETLLALGRPAEALRHAQAALAAYDQNEEVVDRTAALLVLSRVHRALGRDREALLALEEYHRLRGRLDALATRRYASYLMARVGLERARAEARAQRQIASELKDLNDKLTGQAATLEAQARALTRARAEAEEASRAKSAFLANMSHELRTPLNAILGFSEMLRDGLAGPAGPTWNTYAGHVHSAGYHLLSVINDVLDLSKIEAGRVELAIEPVDLPAALAECRELIQPLAEQGDIALAMDCDPSLGMVPADPVRLKQILLNLLSNAVKFTPAGGRVSLTASRSDRSVELRVTDTGSGMTEAELKVALEVFGQIDSTIARKHQGSGLGLPIAVSLAELHGGSLQIKSEKGGGTIATVSLPIFGAPFDAATLYAKAV
ncbi:hypothetical protein GCM10011611_40880 [Aliidongia dinghuensis]|uniref:histidine kinase n=1 Tax=Aliidongia dinghuensis TaxID=1867774 RepID=A0A8J2YW65_9PROT|nr:tetratricopeptide repeat-containing sensor histidine kinase [Aliidongia dinghuensis]GGF30595.1 hypothetical protein GCM10011611_40880 [Aliidongia dinghuensis]